MLVTRFLASIHKSTNRPVPVIKILFSKVYYRRDVNLKDLRQIKPRFHGTRVLFFANLKSPIRGFIFRKPGFIFRKISHILVCFYTVNSQKCPKYPKIFARSARGFIFRKSQISNSRFGVLFFANLKYKIPYRGFKKGGFIHIMVVVGVAIQSWSLEI